MTTCCSSPRSLVHRGIISILVASALCAAAFVGSDGSGVAKTSRGLDPAMLFPASTVMTLSIDGGPCAEHSKDLAISKIWHEPEVQEFLKGSLDLMKEQIETGEKGFAEGLGLKPADLEALAKIRIVFGVTNFKMAEGKSGPPAVDLMLAADLKGQQKTAEALLKMFEAQMGAGEEGAIKDTTIAGVPAKTMAVPPGTPFKGVSYLFHEGWLLAGTSAAQLEAAITRAKSGDAKDSLASNASYAAGMKEVARPKTIVSFYLDYSVLTGIAAEAGDEPGVKEMMTTSGLGSMKALAFGMELDGASIRERAFGSMAPNSPLMQLTTPVDPAGILGRIPKRSIMASMGSINLRGMFEYFKKVMGALPQAGDMLDEGMAEVDKILGPTWKEDLLPNLGPEYAIFVATAQFGLVPDVGVLIKIGNRAKIEAAVAKMLERPEAKAAARSLKFLDSTINYLDLGAMGIDKDLNLRPAWVFVDDYLLLTMCPHSAKSVLTSWAQKDGGLMAREDFAKTFNRLKGESPNAGSTGVAYLDAQWLAGFLIDNAIPLVQSAISPAQLEKLGPMGALDLGKLPSTQAITKHLSCVMMQGQPKEGGSYTEFVSPMGIVGTAIVVGATVGAMSSRMGSDMMGGEVSEPSEHGARHRVRKPKAEDKKDKDDKDEDKDK